MRTDPALIDETRTQDAVLVDALRRGDETAFAGLVDTYGSSLLRLAMVYVPSRAVAEEVVQETWLGVLVGLDRFEGRSSLKTWIHRILVNRAKTRGGRERRTVPFSSLASESDDEDASSVDPDRFLPPDHEQWPGHWAAPPSRWPSPERRLESAEAREVILGEIERLPASQREVIVLRDIEGWDGHEVCTALGLSAGNQRVLLHRARSRVRAALERYFDGEAVGA